MTCGGNGAVAPLGDRQRAFAQAILDPTRPVPPGLVGPDGAPSGKRFAVYRNGVVAGLVEALRLAYPAVLRLVGDAFFAAMARLYAARRPPSSPIMLDYGASFPLFIEGFEPAAELPYLADVARLERAWTEAYHAAEAAPLDAVALGALSSDELTGLGFSLHPSVRIVRSRFPVVSIWRQNVADFPTAPIDLRRKEDALVARPDADVWVRRLPSGAAMFIEALAAKATVAEAAAAALREEARFDLADALAGLLQAEALAGWRLADRPLKCC